MSAFSLIWDIFTIAVVERLYFGLSNLYFTLNIIFKVTIKVLIDILADFAYYLRAFARMKRHCTVEHAICNAFYVRLAALFS